MDRWLERFKALSDETRVLLLAALLEEELSVGELAEACRTAQPGVSRHLAALREAGLVVVRKQGTASLYRIVLDDPLLEGPFGQELRRMAVEHKLAARVEKIVSRRRARTEEFFERTENWDALRAELFTEAAALFSVLRLVPKGLSVADIGTGTGGMLPYLAEVADQIVAVDLSAEMLRRAKAKAQSLGLTNVTFAKGDFAHLPLADASVDAAFSVLVLHHAPRPLIALREMRRVVRPGGAVVVVDLLAHGHEWLKEEQADIWLGFAKEEMQSLFEKAGLEEIRLRGVSRVEVKGKGHGSPLELFVASGRVRNSLRGETGANQ
ncbi:MAG: metalloregulator ArsR/SmtB family transcription factor [Deltaproteobacteria bacterium]|nr:metalloregulator ArsR/SmtB family transcription factor [Deltaproteobacteria bacterium]